MKTIEANNIFINYALEGEGKTIVFIHGLSDSLKYWNVLQDELKKKYQTLSFDLRAHGKSSADEREISIDLFTDDLYYLLKNLSIENAVFIGLSLGGNVALNFAVKYPNMVNGLIIMSSFSEFSNDLEKIFDEFQMGISEGFEEFYDIILPYTLPEDVLNRNRKNLELYKLKASKTANVEGIEAGIKAGYGLSITDKLNSIKVPCMVIAGADDNLTDIDLQKKIYDNIEDCEMIILEDTKHNVLIGRNITRILNIIKEFMLKID